ncbi:hypothetical protein SPRG_15193 [Saprolegnia parasitica CBS 223.65]|uniref:Uncharacterized protein n=1 Tax=Saprolegnia parasitica (strain CBS 223.65) TaxID=695850 RepID=A0A067BZ06_SAPPC|nr:hypothetical protein SPRG_15193 [Saprolegnia parasitica CBS 223.65]KDO19556.1 hypothetical protein SPRG_15193 [Saprolegnia parasitica CBS 223.65]|eukprot:XP_012209742.1 hypothetical protein SPRG_15193 [Saprolegnia parasitica CBS 223.65]
MALRTLPERLFCTFQACAICGLLFASSYQRCFPHCCPQHTTRRSCGTSLVVQVGGEYNAEEAATFEAFGRFESSSTTELAIGCPLEVVDGDLRQPGNMRGMWMRCHRDARASIPVTFFVNRNALEDEWHYGWKGSASKVDRAATHVLTVYIRRATDNVVVGLARSSPFTISSARRAVESRTTRLKAMATETDEPVRLLPTTGVSAFEFQGCDCPGDLFRTVYSRGNKTNGRKELRCFPHCCGGHATQSMCGGPIHIHVAFLNAAPVHQYAVYARFEELPMKELEVAMEMPLRYLEANTIRPNAMQSEWFLGVPAGAPLLFPSSEVYVLNANKRSKHFWPYSWKGSASLTKRATRHVLRVYLFQLHHAEARDGVDVLARIIGTLQSPAFQVESQRSSALEHRTTVLLKVPRKRVLESPQSNTPNDDDDENELDEIDTA